MKNVCQLDVYVLSEKLADNIWYAYDGWPKKVQNTIGYQIIDSADSISANIAEGYGRFTYNDRKKFNLYSRGSFEETKAWLRKLIRRRILKEKEILEYTTIINELGPKLNSFISKTK